MIDLTESQEFPDKAGGGGGASNPASMVSAESAENVYPELSPAGKKEALGQCLLDARVKRGLLISDVAQAIKFSPRQIEAIESDGFDKLPGTTFIRGFIRSYAKFLRLDPIPLLAMLDKQIPQAVVLVQEPQDMGAALPRYGAHGSHFLNLKLLLFFSTIILVVVVFAMWFWSTAQEKPVVDTVVTTQKPNVADVVQSPLPVPLPPDGMIGQGQSIQDVPEAQALASIAPDSRQIIFVFEGRSWVEVKDASQRVIFAQNNEPGTRQVIHGKPPFAVVIGNASQVQLLYEDRLIDLPPYTRVDVARFTLE